MLNKKSFNLKVKKLINVIIHPEKFEDFFDRARQAAQKADRGEPFKKLDTISFEDPEERIIAFPSMLKN
jgi:hypothetical protein